MKVIESDPSLGALCRLVEARLGGIPSLATVEIHVILLPHFNDLGHPVTPKDPAAYRRSDRAILVNAQVFPSYSSHLSCLQ